MATPTSFDPQQFLQAQVSEVNEKRAPLPTENPASPDGLYTAVIGDIKMESGTIEKGDRAGRPWLAAVIPLKIEVPQQLQDGLKLPPVLQLTDRAFIDLTDQNTIDNAPGRNRRQKEYREALDLNKPGDIWSWSKANGQVVKLKHAQKMYNGEILDDVQNARLLRRS